MPPVLQHVSVEERTNNIGAAKRTLPNKKAGAKGYREHMQDTPWLLPRSAELRNSSLSLDIAEHGVAIEHECFFFLRTIRLDHQHGDRYIV